MVPYPSFQKPALWIRDILVRFQTRDTDQRIRIRILLFSFLTFKKPKEKFFCLLLLHNFSKIKSHKFYRSGSTNTTLQNKNAGDKGLVLGRGLHRDVVYLCCPIAPSNTSPNAGSQPTSSAVHITWHGAQIKFGDLPPYDTGGHWPTLLPGYREAIAKRAKAGNVLSSRISHDANRAKHMAICN